MNHCLPKILVIAVFFSVLVSACGVKGGGKDAEKSASRTIPNYPSVPSVITDPVEINEYIAGHFWDSFLDGSYPDDSTTVNGVLSEEAESALGRYVTVLENALEKGKAIGYMEEFFRKISDFQKANPSSSVFGYFETMVPKYLYDPNSPVRDEDLYLPYVKGLSKSSFSKEEMKPSYLREAAMCSLNQYGTKAADILFTERDGSRKKLYGIGSDYTVLLFSNPGCPNCEEVIGNLTSNPALTLLLASGEVSVVNLYIDQELDKWKASAAAYPKEWINGYDQDYVIRNDLTYSVRAIPSLYLLDKDKKVLMKDAPPEKIISFLEKI